MIKIKDLSVKIKVKEIISGISLQIQKGEMISIIGPNGAGKSTFLKSILNLNPDYQGHIEFTRDSGETQSIRQIPVKETAKLFAYIPQEVSLQFDFTVEDLILMGRYPWTSQSGRYSQQDYEIVNRLIRHFQIEALRNRNYMSLSGGEKQRVLLAKALAQDTAYIFLDETLSFLDINHQIEIMKLLKEINHEQQKSIIIVSHNINLSIEFSDRLIALNQGKVIADGPAEEIINETFIHTLFGINMHLLNNPYSNKPNLLYVPKG